MRKTLLIAAAAGSISCGEKTPECPSLDGADFDADSGWNSASYCDAPNDLGCFPFHESAEDTCGPFTTMRTSATDAAGVGACESLISDINCGTFTNDGDTELTFHVETPDRLTMSVFGTYQGREVDTVFHFNPCDPGCQAAVTLDTIDPQQQTICEIPRQGKPACLFPDSAHVVSFVRADADGMVMRTNGVETVLSRATDAE